MGRPRFTRPGKIRIEGVDSIPYTVLLERGIN